MAREIKITTFNVEWMVDLFVPGKPDLLIQQNKKTPGLGAKPKNPQQAADKIAAVIKEVDPDIIGICEGPPLTAQMERFVDDKLGGMYSVYSLEDGTQSVHCLVHKRLEKDVRISQLSKSDKVYERLRKVRIFHKYGEIKNTQNGRFTRLPVILRLERKGKITEIMVVHTKSKFSSLRKVSQWTKREKDAIVSAILSRQKLSMEMNVIRKYIAHRLYSQAAEAIIVMGDMNDGVTRDVIDETYLLHSIVQELRGAFHHELALMRHALTGKQLQKKSYAWTVEFNDPANRGKPTRVLLDHIIFSPACNSGGSVCFVKNSGQVEHAAYNKHVTNSGRSRDERPSDHRPLSARFALL